MATYILLVNFTDQGIRNVKDTIKRADAFKTAANKAGASVKEIYWTLGQYDGALIIEAPDDAKVTSLALGAGAGGNIRTQVLRAFTAADIGPILAGMPQ